MKITVTPHQPEPGISFSDFCDTYEFQVSLVERHPDLCCMNPDSRWVASLLTNEGWPLAATPLLIGSSRNTMAQGSSQEEALQRLSHSVAGSSLRVIGDGSYPTVDAPSKFLLEDMSDVLMNSYKKESS